MIPLGETLRMRVVVRDEQVARAVHRYAPPRAQLRAGGRPAISRVTRSGVSRDAREDSVPIQLENAIQAGEVHITRGIRCNAKRCTERHVHSPDRRRWRRAARERRNHILLGGGGGSEAGSRK